MTVRLVTSNYFYTLKFEQLLKLGIIQSMFLYVLIQIMAISPPRSFFKHSSNNATVGASCIHHRLRAYSYGHRHRQRFYVFTRGMTHTSNTWLIQQLANVHDFGVINEFEFVLIYLSAQCKMVYRIYDIHIFRSSEYSA